MTEEREKEREREREKQKERERERCDPSRAPHPPQGLKRGW